VFGNQATTYAVRAHRRIWSAPHPSGLLVLSSVTDLLLATSLAAMGCLMMPISPVLIFRVPGGAVGFAFVLDVVKVSGLRRLEIA
jgi:hypothetical protein